MKTLNIRLTPTDAAAVRQLKSNGENVSEIVRSALRERASQPRLAPQRITKTAIRSLLEKIDASQSGEPVPEYIRLGVDPAIRQQASAYLRLRLAKRLGEPFG